jgi:hypothetical protein
VNAHCNTAGVWDVNLSLASFQIGEELEPNELLQVFGPEIYIISESKWLVTGFLRDQQNNRLKVTQKAHKSAIECVLRLEIGDRYREPLTITVLDDEGNLTDHVFEGKSKDPPSSSQGVPKDLSKSVEGPQAKATATVKAKAESKTVQPSMEDVIRFCEEIGLPENDGEYIYLNWEENGWKNTKTKQPIKDWKSTIRKWKTARYFPSQKAVSGTSIITRKQINYDEGF